MVCGTAAIFISITAMLTKAKKHELVKEGKSLLETHEGVMLVDFSGRPFKELSALRSALKEVGAKLKIIRKRLLRIVFQDNKIALNPADLDAQVGTVFFSGDAYEIARLVHEAQMPLLGGYSLKEGKVLERTFLEMLGSLPSRDVLLSQLAFMVAAPIRSLLYVLKEKAARSTSSGAS